MVLLSKGGFGCEDKRWDSWEIRSEGRDSLANRPFVRESRFLLARLQGTETCLRDEGEDNVSMAMFLPGKRVRGGCGSRYQIYLNRLVWSFSLISWATSSCLSNLLTNPRPAAEGLLAAEGFVEWRSGNVDLRILAPSFIAALERERRKRRWNPESIPFGQHWHRNYDINIKSRTQIPGRKDPERTVWPGNRYVFEFEL